MVDVAVASLIVIMTDNAGGVSAAGFAVGDGIDNCRLQRQTLWVGLRCGVVLMAEVAAVASSVMQGINIGLTAEGSGAGLTKGGGVTGVAVGARGAGAKGDRTEVVVRGAVVSRCSVTNGAVPAAGVACGATCQGEIGAAVA